MSLDLAFWLTYCVVLGTWIIGSRHRHRWRIDGIVSALAHDLRVIWSRLLPIFGYATPGASANPHRLDPLAAEKLAYVHGDIEIDEYESRVERLLAGQSAQPPSDRDREAVQALLAYRRETR